MFGEEQVKFHFSKFRDKPYRKDLEDEQGKTIAGLAAIFYGTPIEDQDEDLEGENLNEDIEDEELGEYLDSIPIIDSPMNEKYEEPERRGDEELPPPQLKPLPDGLRYEFLDETNRFPKEAQTSNERGGKKRGNTFIRCWDYLPSKRK